MTPYATANPVCTTTAPTPYPHNESINVQTLPTATCHVLQDQKLGAISQQQQSIALPMANGQNDGRSSEPISPLQRELSYPTHVSPPPPPHIHIGSSPSAHSYLLPLQPVQCKTSSAGIEDSNLSTEGSVSLHVSPSSLTSPFEHDTEVSAPNTSPALSCPDATPLLESPCIPPNVQRVRSIAPPKVQPTQSLPLRRSKRLKSEHTSSPLDLDR